MPSLRPPRALLHPAWLAALALLALNDHVLKQGHILPGWITGKLSDAAGLFLAPALAAAVLRVRTHRGLALVHAAVGALFAVVKTVPFATHAAEALLCAIVPSRLWTDPSDLLALPALALAWRTLVPWMERGEAGRTRRALELAAGAVAGAACMATSYAVPPAKLRNASGRLLVIHVASLDAQVSADADVTLRPELPLTRALFEAGERVILHDGQELDLSARSGDEARLILVEGGPGWVTRVRHGAVYVIARGAGGDLAFESDAPIVALTSTPPSCARSATLAWDPLPAPGELRVRAVTDLEGGCREVEFEGGSRPWRYCSPDAAWPFAVGDALVSTGDALARREPAPRTALLLASTVEPIAEDVPLCVSVDPCGGVLVEGVGRIGADLKLRSGESRSYGSRTFFAGTMRVAPIRSARCGTPKLEGGYAIVDTDWKGGLPGDGADATVE
jgi:hypothetical protein